MPSIVSFHRNVGHAVILIILFSFFYLATPVCRFIHLLSETTQDICIISIYKREMPLRRDGRSYFHKTRKGNGNEWTESKFMNICA